MKKEDPLIYIKTPPRYYPICCVEYAPFVIVHNDIPTPLLGGESEISVHEMVIYLPVPFQ